MRWLPALILVLASTAIAQQPVAVDVDAGSSLGPLRSIWNYFGYDEPNYTYTANGRKLVHELAAAGVGPVYFRTHSLLVTGDGRPALKWGSTNAYTEDAAGNPVYDWTIVDRIFDTYLQAGARPFVELGFMPRAMSTRPEPYRHSWPDGAITAGWAFPPKDYGKWRELIRRLVLHCVERYGRSEVVTWYWEVWNEPDILYWQGTPEQYNQLYDAAAAGVKSALPEARVGGPATTGPAGDKAAAFLKQFLDHCARSGAPLDFVSYHAKGRPAVVDGHVRMGLSKNLQDVARGLDVLGRYPQFRNLPIVLSESDPEGCAACSARVYPQNAYRNGPLYPCYTAAAIRNILALAARHGANIEGMLTWAFEFEDQPYFHGFRSLATNGIDKPVLNLFRMLGMLRGERVKVSSTGAAGLDSIIRDGVTAAPDIDALAARSGSESSVLIWNYHDDDVPAPDAPVSLTVRGLPAGVARLLVRHYRIDRNHSNAYSVWQAMGSPQKPTPEQYSQLEASGQLELLESPRWVSVQNGRVTLPFSLPRQAVSLIELSW